MDLGNINITTAIDVFLLLLIGIGPKIALVPFLDITKKLDASTKTRVTRKMLATAFVAALALILLGGFLTRLLHFSTGALAISSGLILVALSIPMVIRNKPDSVDNIPSKNPLGLASSPLAIPYLLNPVGIVVLVTISAESPSIHSYLLVLVVLLSVLVVDALTFRWANKVSQQLDEGRMLVVEKVFGFLLAALAVQLVLHGLDSLGLIHLISH